MTGCAASSERCRKRNPMRARFRAAAGDHAGRSLRCPQRDRHTGHLLPLHRATRDRRGSLPVCAELENVPVEVLLANGRVEAAVRSELEPTHGPRTITLASTATDAFDPQRSPAVLYRHADKRTSRETAGSVTPSPG
jgi:hypothetical protein